MAHRRYRGRHEREAQNRLTCSVEFRQVDRGHYVDLRWKQVFLDLLCQVQWPGQNRCAPDVRSPVAEIVGDGGPVLGAITVLESGHGQFDELRVPDLRLCLRRLEL